MVGKAPQVEAPADGAAPLGVGHASTSVRLHDIVRGGLRLEAASHGIEARAAVAELQAGSYPTAPLFGAEGLCPVCSTPLRFRRVYVRPERGVPFLTSSDIISMRPEVDRYISKALTNRLEEIRIRRWDVMISRSGTVGNVGLAGRSFEGMALSEDALRLQASDPETAGFVTAFLRSSRGRVQLLQVSYGSVIVHIEPEHLRRVLVPNVAPILRTEIGGSMRRAVELRDEANDLLGMADTLLHQRLNLAPLADAVGRESGPYIASVRASQLKGRLEGTYHSPVAHRALEQLRRTGATIVRVGNPEITREVRPITKFRKRTYVPRGGIPFYSSKQLFQVDPIDVKRLAKGAHEKDLPEIALETGMIVVTRSGTIGRVQIIPGYMEGWAGSEHATRVLAAEGMNPGFLYAWLASDYGRALITRHAYGSVILEVDKDMLASIPVPMPAAKIQDEIGNLVLRANELRDQAWKLERTAIAAVDALSA